MSRTTTNPRSLYLHPDGFPIVCSDLTRTLECHDDADRLLVEIPIGETGLIDLVTGAVAQNGGVSCLQ